MGRPKSKETSVKEVTPINEATPGKEATAVKKERKEKQPRKSSGAKRKRKASDSESEKITDPVEDEDFLKDLPEDDHGEYQKYNKDKQWKLNRNPHHFLPSFNLTQFTDINDVRELPLTRVSLPQSVYVGSKQINDIDICHRRTKALSRYLHRLKSVRTAYLTAKKKKKVRKDEKNGIYSRNFIDFAKRRDINPDIYFAKAYDFYYTGGNLCVNPTSDQILHVSGSNMDKLILSACNIENRVLSMNEISRITLAEDKKEESEIFEVQFSTWARDSFFVRRRLCVSLHQYNGDKMLSLQKYQSKEVPIISFAQDKVNRNHLAISNLQHQVRLYDLETSRQIKVFQLVPKEKVEPAMNWNMIRSWDSHTYLYASCRRLDVIDTRIRESEWRSNYCGYEEENTCDTFCSVAVSNFDNLFYLGSNHKLYCLDKRFMGKNIESRNAAVSRWTHLMSSYPLMMATSRYNDREYITIQSPLSADLRICENIQFLPEPDIMSGVAKKSRTELPVEYKYKSPCLPFMPPSLENVLQQARLQGKCIKPITGIVNRIQACITGLGFAGDSSNPYILTATSNGDVFARYMHEPDDDIRVDAAEVMSKFEENIFRSVRKPPLQVTEVSDLSGISKVFRCSALSDIRPQEDTFAIPSKRKYMGRWQKSIQSLYKYKDALVSDLLSVWDVEAEDEKDFNITALNQSTVTDSNSLVTGWLNTNESAIPSMTSIPMDVFNASSAVAENSFEEKFNVTDTPVELDQTTVSTAKPKGPKKKQRYIKGF